jgi:hypothetical protein
VSSGLLLAALAIISRTCFFYLELEYMVVFAMFFLDLIFFGFRRVLFSLCYGCFVVFS